MPVPRLCRRLLLRGGRALPPYLIWLTTARCNARCAHCFHSGVPEGTGGPDLSTGEAVRFFERYGPLVYLSLGGGEPSLREDLPDVVGVATRRCGPAAINCISNGFLPERLAAQAGRIARDAPDTATTFTLSIDGLFEAHDRRRGVEGGFERLLESADRLKRLAAEIPNLAVSTNTTFTPDNAAEIDAIHAFVTKRLELPHRLILFRNPHDWKWPPPALDVGAFVRKAREVERDTRARFGGRGGLLEAARAALDLVRLDVLDDLAAGRPFPWSCRAGRSGLVLAADGELLPCEPLGKSFGNVRDTDCDARNLLSGERAREILAGIAGCRCTWECQLRASLPWQPSRLPGLVRHCLRQSAGRS